MPTNDPTQDKDFLAATPERQHAYLMQADSGYAGATPERQQAYLAQFRPTHSSNPSNPATMPGAIQASRGDLVRNVTKPEDVDALQHPYGPDGANGFQTLHSLLQKGAQNVGRSVDDNDLSNLRKAAHGERVPPIGWTTYGQRMLRSTLQAASDMTTPAGIATTVGVAAANTNPVTGIPVDAALAAHGGYGVYKNRQSLKDLVTTGQANPDQLQSGLNSAAEMTGGLAGAGAQTKTALHVPIEQQNAAIQKSLDPGWGKREAFQKDLTGARPYLGGKGVQSAEDLKALVPQAKADIWEPATKAFKQFGDEPVQGPDGATTYNKLEARRQELSAQLQGVRDRDPAAVQTVFQQGKNPASLASEQSSIENLLDERMRKAGINYPVLRNTYGSVSGIGRQVSGTNTISEAPKPYGIGRAWNDLNLFRPGTWVGGARAGLADIAAGRPWFSGKPTDVGIAEGLRDGAPAPTFQTTTHPTPFGPQLPPPASGSPPPANPRFTTEGTGRAGLNENALGTRGTNGARFGPKGLLPAPPTEGPVGVLPSLSGPATNPMWGTPETSSPSPSWGSPNQELLGKWGSAYKVAPPHSPPVPSDGAPTPSPSTIPPSPAGAEAAPKTMPYAGAERRTSLRDITGPSDERINLMRYLGQKAAAGDKIAAAQLADIQAHPFESARSVLGGSDINSMKAVNEKKMTRAEAEANTTKRAAGRNQRFATEPAQ